MAEFKTPDRRVPRAIKKVEMNADSPQMLIIPPSPCMKQLGYGTGVNVYLMDRFSPRQGCYKSPWAVKKINKNVKFAESGERIRFEASVLKELNHPNIIGYRSDSKGKDGFPVLMMESGEKSLSQLLEERQEENFGPLPAKMILKTLKDVASGLHYLHHEKRILHGDLKSANILVKGDFSVCKLCDFGVALKLDEKGEVACENYVGTECWSAPEVLTCGKVTDKSDIFALGLTIWEMLALNAPHIDKLDFEDMEEEDYDSAEALEAWQANQAACDEAYQKSLGTRPGLPNVELGEEYLPVIEIFYACTETDPNLRPSAVQIIEALNTLKCIKTEVHKRLSEKQENILQEKKDENTPILNEKKDENTPVLKEKKDENTPVLKENV